MMLSFLQVTYWLAAVVVVAMAMSVGLGIVQEGVMLIMCVAEGVAVL